jgi:hypothetical protein
VRASWRSRSTKYGSHAIGALGFSHRFVVSATLFAFAWRLMTRAGLQQKL